MKVEPFDCCSAYNECSDLGLCVRDIDHRGVCTYWNRNLSQGVAFYGKNPGIIEGHIFITIEGRVFRISKRAKDYSYVMDREYIKALAEELKRLGIMYSTRPEGECLIVGSVEEPAKYKIDFVIDQREYTIKNYNGYLLEGEAVMLITEEIGDRLKLISNPPLTRSRQNHGNYREDYSGYYGRETVITYGEVIKAEQPKKPVTEAPKPEQKEEAPKEQKEEGLQLPRGGDLKGGKFVQSSIWDLIYGRI